MAGHVGVGLGRVGGIAGICRWFDLSRRLFSRFFGLLLTLTLSLALAVWQLDGVWVNRWEKLAQVGDELAQIKSIAVARQAQARKRHHRVPAVR